MFKIICDIELRALEDHIPPIVEGYNIIIGYKNCTTCYIDDNIKLTSTDTKSSIESVAQIVSAWNKNALNPMNVQYHEAYRDILTREPFIDLKNLKMLVLFSENPALVSQIKHHTPLEVFETIIDITVEENPYLSSYGKNSYKTGYKVYHEKSVLLQFNNVTDSTIISNALIPYNNDKYVINPAMVAYLLRYKENVLDCNKKDYPNSLNNSLLYLEFLEQEYIKKLTAVLSSVTQCKVDGKKIAMIGGSNELCSELGGKLLSPLETIIFLCKFEQEDYILSDNDYIYKGVTCGNYESLMQFDDNGEILGVQFKNPESYPLVHDEL